MSVTWGLWPETRGLRPEAYVDLFAKVLVESFQGLTSHPALFPPLKIANFTPDDVSCKDKRFRDLVEQFTIRYPKNASVWISMLCSRHEA